MRPALALSAKAAAELGPALALAAPLVWKNSFDPAADHGWQRLWLATQRRAWTILAVLPASAGRSSLRAAHALAAVGRRHLDCPVDVVDATAVELAHLETLLAGLGQRRDQGLRTVVALASVHESPSGAAVAASADAALLGVELGDRIADAERTIEEVGPSRFLGTFVLGHGGVE